jgi:hypothetical protein
MPLGRHQTTCNLDSQCEFANIRGAVAAATAPLDNRSPLAFRSLIERNEIKAA